MGHSLGFEKYSGLYLWAVFLAVFGIWVPDSFLTSSTLHSVAAQQAVTGMVALAVLIPLAADEFDLSVGANANFTGILAVLLQTSWHWAVVPACLAAVVAGALIGLSNGFIVVRLRVNSLIATLGTSSILAAGLIIITNSTQPFPPESLHWSELTQLKIAGFQIVVVYLLVLAGVVWWLIDRTPFGRFMFATGGNVEAARLSGVRVDRVAWITLALSGTIAGIAGIFFTSLSGPSLTFGPTLLLPAFAAVFLGSTQLRPGRFNVWGTLIAIYVLATGVVGLQLASGAQWLSQMFSGVALIVAVALAVGRQRRDAKVQRRSSRRDGKRVENIGPSSAESTELSASEPS